MRNVGLMILAVALTLALNPLRSAAQAPRARTADQPVTFAKDVAPIFQRACQNCHRPDTAAPMSLLTYNDVRPWAQSIKAKVLSREMPPWHVDRNVGIAKFKDDPSLSDAEIATIVNWVDQRAPLGNPADMPPPRQFDALDAWHIGKPDLIVTAPLHTVPAAGADWWGDYIVPTGLTEDRYIKAVEAKPRDKAAFRVLHHLITSALAPSDEAAATNGADDTESGGVFLNEYSVGKGGDIFPEGSGRLLKAGSKIRFGFHYHSVGEAVTDQAQLAFVLYPKGYVPKHVQNTRMLGNSGGSDIPAGAAYVRGDAYSRFESAGMLTGFQPHMHERGKAQCLELIYPTHALNEKVEQIGCAKFSFGWVMAYNWADDVTPIYPAGTILHVITWHDNSPTKNNPDPTNWVGHGNRTTDEMGFSWVNYYDLSDQEYKQILTERRALEKRKVPTGTTSQPHP
jgi:hypothetical protein